MMNMLHHDKIQDLMSDHRSQAKSSINALYSSARKTYAASAETSINQVMLSEVMTCTSPARVKDAANSSITIFSGRRRRL